MNSITHLFSDAVTYQLPSYNKYNAKLTCEIKPFDGQGPHLLSFSRGPQTERPFFRSPPTGFSVNILEFFVTWHPHVHKHNIRCRARKSSNFIATIEKQKDDHIENKYLVYYANKNSKKSKIYFTKKVTTWILYTLHREACPLQYNYINHNFLYYPKRLKYGYQRGTSIFIYA